MMTGRGLELIELDPATLRAMAVQLDDVADMALSNRTPTPEQRAIASFASGTAARYKSTAIAVEQARAERRAAAERAMRAPTVELPVFVPLAGRPAPLRDEAPCRICRRPALVRDAAGQPCHKVCAEAEIEARS